MLLLCLLRGEELGQHVSLGDLGGRAAQVVDRGDAGADRDEEGDHGHVAVAGGEVEGGPAWGGNNTRGGEII